MTFEDRDALAEELSSGLGCDFEVEVAFDLAFDFGFGFGVVARLNKITTIAGEIKNMFNTSGADAYIVIANRMAHTLSRKSAAAAMGVYGVKKDWVFCRAVQRRTADWTCRRTWLAFLCPKIGLTEG